ncbi:YdeI family protein [Nocardia sp. NPDC056100]|uniref:YdeI/OmpD-associated family protein n=1 Tax=Nocardia sp. NPDC056100 TaxID=3345712 RepID=UPI0035DD6A1F
MPELAELLVPDTEAWHAWLDSHHADHPGVWLVLHKKGGRTTTLSYAQALDEALCFGWIDGQIARRDDDSYRQRFTPRRSNSPWSARNVEHIARLIQAGRMRPPGVAAVERAKAGGRWYAAYEGQRTTIIPEDLQRELDRDPVAAAAFAELDARNRYSIFWRINEAKRPETRRRRIATFLDMLRRGERLHR